MNPSLLQTTPRHTFKINCLQSIVLC